MSGVNYLAVQYYGTLPILRDNIIHGSGRVWHGQYSSVRVPENEVHKYVDMHRDMFRLLHPLFLESPYAESLSKDDQIYAMLSIASNLELHAAEELLIACQARVRELAEERGHAQASPTDRIRFNERRQKIADAITAMDPSDQTQYTDLGKPRVSAVAKISKVTDVSSAEIVEVLRQMKQVG
jgi:hypothetical protein